MMQPELTTAETDDLSLGAAEITDQKQVQEELRTSEARLSFAMESSHTGAWELSLLDNKTTATPTHDRIYGYNTLVPFWTREKFFEHVLPDERAEVDRIIREAVAANTEWNFECRIRRTDGKVRWIWATGAYEKDSEGKTVGMAGIVQDITERKDMEDALRASEARYRKLFEYAPDGILTADPKGYYLDANASMCRMLGLTRDELIGKHTSEIVAQAEIQHIELALSVINAKSDYQREWEFRRKDASIFSGDVIATMMPDGKLLAVVRDITRRRQTEDALRESYENLERKVIERTAELQSAKDRAESANKELESFSFSVSHDLRAPLRQISSFIDIVLENCAGQLNETNLKHLQTVNAVTRRMGELINAMLVLSSVTRDEIHRCLVDLNALAAEVIAELRDLDPNRLVKFEIAPGMIANGDKRLLRIVLANLLGNAWKYSQKRVEARIEFGKTARDATETYFVRDNGAGFDMAFVGKIFGAFARLHSGADFEGNGIGLATVQRIIHRHNGKIWAESIENQGATFYFTLGDGDPKDAI